MWYVLCTKPKTEIKVADNLRRIDLEVFCPVVEEMRQWSDRKKKVKVPLFRSYVFVRLPEKQRRRVFEVPGVVKYLYWLGKPAIVRDVEVTAIQSWLEGDELMDIAVEKISPGDRVIISKGSFRNKKAIVIEIGPRRVRLMLPEIGFTISARTVDVLSA